MFTPQPEPPIKRSELASIKNELNIAKQAIAKAELKLKDLTVSRENIIGIPPGMKGLKKTQS